MGPEKNGINDIENNVVNEQDNIENEKENIPKTENITTDIQNNSNTKRRFSISEKLKKLNFKKIAPVLIAGVVCFGLGFGTSRILYRNKTFTKNPAVYNNKGNMRNHQFNERQGIRRGNRQNSTENNTQNNTQNHQNTTQNNNSTNSSNSNKSGTTNQ